MMEREYIVTAKTKEDLESLYNDLETLGGCDCIPEREITCVHRRPISRNTHYYLSEEEAELIKKDSRVLGVELTPEEKGVEISPYYTIAPSTGGWDKSTSNNDSYRNWGFYRCINGSQVTNWGVGATAGISGTVLATSSGRDVDVVIVDGCFDPSHPEFQVNENGTGGTRVVQFNWFSLNPTVTGGSAGTYLYVNSGGTYINGSTAQQTDNNHGCHVAGTVAGNRRGWARDAKIYNINPYSTAPSVISNSLMFDYIRAWHNGKSVNTTTGRKNPTITNHSYGQRYSVAITDINYVIYRGTQYNNPTAAQLTGFGLINDGTNVNDIPYASTAQSADLIDAINDGIIFVGAAGNSNYEIDIPGGEDYDNIINYNFSGFSYSDYYNRGSSPSHLPEFICVGNIGADSTERKNTSSNCGPRIDVWAPGSNITSSVHDNGGGANDSRNASYNITKYSGTSMASPNVAGVLACIAEQWPRMTQSEAKSFLTELKLAKQNQITDGTGNLNLRGSPNRYLQYTMVRRVPNPSGSTYIGGQTTSQITFPNNTTKFRPVKTDGNLNTDIYASGYVYPRRPIWHRKLT